VKKERQYQTQGINKVFERLDAGITKQIFSLCTGAGKTFVASRISKKFKRILFLVHVEELAEQAGKAMLFEYYGKAFADQVEAQYGDILTYFRHLEEPNLFVTHEESARFGIIKADMFKIDSHITIGSLQTIHRRLDRIPADWFDLIIYDECHTAGAKTFKKTLDYFKPKLLLGLTATPYRADGASLADIFDEIVFQYSILHAIKDGYLCELDAIQIRTKISLDSVKTTAGDFNQKELQQKIDTPERNKLIVESYKKYAEGKQNLVFCVDVEHAQNLCKTFVDAGYKAEFVVGDVALTPDRKDVIKRFKNGDTRILINVAVLIAGFDHPGIGCLTIASPTKSKVRYIQQLGRATRTLAGVIDELETPEERIEAIKLSKKPSCIILDVVDVSSKHKLINTWTLDRDKPIEERVFTTGKKKDVLLKIKKGRLMDADISDDKRINLIPIQKIKIRNTFSVKEPASRTQLKKLKGLGYDTEGKYYNKADAHIMINSEPAPDSWISILQAYNFDVSCGVTRTEALQILNDYRKCALSDDTSELNYVISKNLAMKFFEDLSKMESLENEYQGI
jgi:superfamily II DNA or RNA helicase